MRRACLRIDQAAPGATRRVLQLAGITVPLGAFLSTTLITTLLLLSESAKEPAYRFALILQGMQSDNIVHGIDLRVQAECQTLVRAAAGSHASICRHSHVDNLRACRSGCLCGGSC